MPYAFLNSEGDVLGLSTSDVSLQTYQDDFDSTAVERIVGAPDGLVTTYRAGRWGNPDWYSRKTGGDGTHIEDYTNIDVPPVPNLQVQPVEVKNVAVDSNKRTVTVPEPETDKKMVNLVTHNFCDKTTWWQGSVQVTDETLTDSGDQLTFNSTHGEWIDLTHGKFYLEDRVTDRDNYIPVVKVDGVTKTERAPFSDSGGDYEVNYHTGAVTFFATQTGVVTASYYYASSSLFIVAPEAGKVLWVRDSEVQFSVDVVMSSTINFQAWAYNPADLPNKMPVSEKTNYKTLRNFIEEAKGVYPEVPAIGGSGPRGMSQAHVVFPFKYTQVKSLPSSMGVEIRVWMDEDVEFDGEFGTATFYCSSYDES